MKRHHPILLVFVLCLFTSNPLVGSPVTEYGQLETREGKITAAKVDHPVQVKGLSLFWGNTGWGQEKQWTAENVRRFADDWGITIIRAAMGVEDSGGYLNVQEDGSYLIDVSNKERLITVVDAAIDAGIYVVIDWHSHHAEEHTESAKSFFDEMAQKYGQHDNVIFEIYNEPLNDIPWQDIKAYAEEVIPVIRKHSDNLILVGTRTWSQRVDEAAEDPISQYSNIAYVLHFYVASHGESVREHAKNAIQQGLPIFVSEWGFWGDSDKALYENDTGMSGSDWLDWLDSHQISWCAWAVSDKDEPSSLLKENGSSTVFGEFVKQRLNQ